ncbi:MAG: N-acetylglucosamine kinase [Candidatus Flexifilum sp.]|jgi:N-acetylglucosamine kinase-like BadF-type ATPase
MTRLYMGIDGGGSTLRVAIVDEALTVIAQAQRETVNPSTIGRETAARRIQDAMREVLAAVGQPVAAVGIGVAGASAVYAEDWLRATVGAVLPDVPVVASMDHEIALVGAHGMRRGVIVLAGTGSVACAINARGEWAQAGGWGYLLGDEGSGVWLALEGLRAFVRYHDGVAPEAADLAGRMQRAFGFTRPADVIPWLYRQPPPTRELAQYADVVLRAADDGDLMARDIIQRGAAALAQIAQAAAARVGATFTIRFCGGLLTADNALSRALCERLGLDAIPYPLYPPVVGAALLARDSLP